MNLQGEASLLDVGVPDYIAVKERYLACFPQSAMMFGFADFALWELRLEDAHLVLGFGQAYLAHAMPPLAWLHQRDLPPIPWTPGYATAVLASHSAGES